VTPARAIGRARDAQSDAGRARTGRVRPIALGVSSGGPIDRARLLTGLIAGAVVVGVAVVAFALLSGAGRVSYSCAELLQPQAGATVADPIVTPDMGRNHLAVGSRLEYAECPPASGPHYSATGVAPVRPGFYAADAGIGPGSWVHNLEHGFVVALYRCPNGSCPSEDVLSDLRQFVLQGPSTATSARCGYQSKVLAARFDDIATPFALLAWDHVLLLDTFEVSTALDFARTWIEQPELPERVSC
jgi:hypothetical protein